MFRKKTLRLLHKAPVLAYEDQPMQSCHGDEEQLERKPQKDAQNVSRMVMIFIYIIYIYIVSDILIFTIYHDLSIFISYFQVFNFPASFFRVVNQQQANWLSSREHLSHKPW